MIVLLFIFFTLDADDSEFIDTLFAQQRSNMYDTSLRILGSEQDAQDAIGDAFLKITENIKHIQKLPCHKTVPYCVIIVKSCCMTILRRRKKVLPMEPEQEEQIADDCLTIEEAYFKGEDAALVTSLMAKLSPADRQQLRLHYMEDLSYREMAELLNISEATVRKREQRALQRLRKLYAEEVGHERKGYPDAGSGV